MIGDSWLSDAWPILRKVRLRASHMDVPKRVVIGFLFKRIADTATWQLVRAERDGAELWRGAIAWPGERDDRQAWVYVGLAQCDNQADEIEFIDARHEPARQLAMAKLAAIYPNARVIGSV